MSIKLLRKNCHLYSLWSGQLRVYEGDVHERWRADGTFVTTTRNFACSVEPEIVHNAVVWLPEQNESLAKQILIQYHEKEISKLKEKIDNHLNKILILKGVNQ